MSNLSPAAQAVLRAYEFVADAATDSDDHKGIAAALRAAADQVVPKDDDPSEEWTTKDEIRYVILAIATELEGAS